MWDKTQKHVVILHTDVFFFPQN